MNEDKVSFKTSQKDKELAQKCFDLAGMMMVVINNSQITTLVNQKTCEVLGYSKKEIIGKNWFDIFLPEEIRDETKAVFKNLLNGAIQVNEHVINEVLTKHGERRLISWHNAFFRDMNGNITETLSSGEDITDRKQIEKVLTEEREKFHALTEHAPFGIVMINKDWKFEYINRKFIEIFGYGPYDIPNSKEWFRKAYPDPEYRKYVIESWVNQVGSFKKGENEPYTFNVVCKNGTRKTINFVPVQLETGEYLITCEDITAQKEAEIALRKSEENYRTIFENAMFGVYRSTLQGQYISVNPAMANMFGYSSPEEMIKDITNTAKQTYVNPADRERFIKLFESGVYTFETQRYRKDRTIFWVSIKNRRVKDENGKVLCYEGIVEDITERKITEDKLEANRVSLQQKNIELEKAYAELKSAQSQILQQEKMASIGQLAAGIAHEINNPIGFIMSNLNSLGKYTERLAQFIELQSEALEAASLHGDNVEMLLKNIGSKNKTLKINYIIDDLGNIIKESLEGAERVKRIVQDLKSFSRIDDAEYKMDDINAGLESTINIVWNELKYKAIVKKEYGVIPRTKCNLGQLNQVFMNLLVNAVQSIKERGDIFVKTAGDKGIIHITIADTGCGIKPENLNHIFEPFYTTKEIGKGTGLGLSIAYDIIKKHNGNITATSEEGKGTSFTISIPIVEE